MTRVPIVAGVALIALLSAAWIQPDTLAKNTLLALRGGRIVTITHGVIDGGTVLCRGSEIVAVGRDVRIPPNAEVIDVSGKTVLPGFVDGFTGLGTFDIDSYGRDDDEATSPVMPHLRVIDGINPANRFLALARRAGITSALSVPGEGNLLSGQSALIHTAGLNVADMVLRFPVAVHATLGEGPKIRYGTKVKLPSTRMGATALLRQSLLDAQDYQEKLERQARTIDTASPKDPGGAPTSPVAEDLKLQALVRVLTRELPLIVSADRMDDVLTAMRIADEFKMRLIISHGTEAFRIAAQLASKGVPVILGPMASNNRRIETSGARLDSAAVLAKAGVRIGFQSGIGGSADELMAQARAAVLSGLSYDDAVRALTIWPADILGASAMIGSLDIGKKADIVVFSADPLRELAKVELVIIDGALNRF